MYNNPILAGGCGTRVRKDSMEFNHIRRRALRFSFVTNARQSIFLLLLFWLANAAAQSALQTIKSFGRRDSSPATPQASLIEGDDGALYGVTDAGGSASVGSIFKVDKNGSALTVLHHFTTNRNDGRYPHGGLIKASDGVLYGTTYLGGSSNWGTIFKINQDGSAFALLHDFTGGIGGLEPDRSLLEASDGLLYGTTQIGGNSGAGTIFRINKDGTGFEIICHFDNSSPPPSPAYPTTGLIEASDGLLYGTSSEGGNWALGTVFRLKKDGSSFEVLHDFGGTASDGYFPETELLQANDGALYGTTQAGGTNGVGVLYRISTNGSSFSVLYTFRTNGAAGNFASGRLIQGSDGLLYGTTAFGGGAGHGIIYKIQITGAGFLAVHNFLGATTDGMPERNQGVIEASDGLLYGATYAGGAQDDGFIYKLNKNGSGYALVWNFIGPRDDGSYPSAPFTEASDHLLYGITGSGGPGWGGTIFKLNPDGSSFTSLHSFTNIAPAPRLPVGGILESLGGKLYGATQFGGASNLGTIFALDKDGSNFEFVHHFSGGSKDGSTPSARLLEGADGAIYGTTFDGGASALGTVFRINKNGTSHTILHHFGRPDGASPASGLIQSIDGLLYGTTQSGGSQNLGAVFRLNTNGSGFSTLHSFAGMPSDGDTPSANLIEGLDGRLYGTSSYGGPFFSSGTVFTLARDGTAYSILHSFGGAGDDAGVPLGGLVEANDGALYGTTTGRAAGTIFRLRKDGSGYSIIYRFQTQLPSGFGPAAGFIQAADGKLYGTTYQGGQFNRGTIFSFELSVRLALELLDAGAHTHFSGFPSATYELLRAPAVIGPWESIGSQVAPASGALDFIDPEPLPGIGFYRAHLVP